MCKNKQITLIIFLLQIFQVPAINSSEQKINSSEQTRTLPIKNMSTSPSQSSTRSLHNVAQRTGETEKRLHQTYTAAAKELAQFNAHVQDSLEFFRELQWPLPHPSFHLPDTNWPVDRSVYTDEWHVDTRKYQGIPSSFLDSIDQQAPQRPNMRRPKTVVKLIDDQIGYGLISQEHIEAGTPIAPYTGRIVRDTSILDSTHDQTLYGVGLTDDYILDGATCTEARFANHSFNPNATLTFFKDPRSGMIQPWLTATTRIPPGKEIRWTYGPRYWYNLKTMPTELPNNTTIAILTNTAALQQYNLLAYADNQPEIMPPGPNGQTCSSKVTLIYQGKQFEIGIIHKVYPHMALVQDKNKLIMVLTTGHIDHERAALVAIPIAIELTQDQKTGVINACPLDNDVFRKDKAMQQAYNRLMTNINKVKAMQYFGSRATDSTQRFSGDSDEFLDN